MRIPFTSMEQLLPFPTAEELVSRKREPVASVSSRATVLEALQRMADKHVGFLPVMDDDKLLGVLSEGDCARRVLLQKLAPEATAVRAVMTTDVHSVPPQTKLPECITLMHEKVIQHLLVMRSNEVVGVLSVHDLMGALLERHRRLLQRFREEQLMLLHPDPSSY